jgi:carboxylesterase type B
VGLTSLLKPILSAVDPIYTGTAQLPGRLISDIIIHFPEAKIVAVAVKNGYQAYRYYFDAVFPNTQRFPAEGAYHASEIPEVSTLSLSVYDFIDSNQLFGTYPEAGASQQQIALGTFSQKAWTGFAKNLPVDQVGSLSERVAKTLRTLAEWVNRWLSD